MKKITLLTAAAAFAGFAGSAHASAYFTGSESWLQGGNYSSPDGLNAVSGLNSLAAANNENAAVLDGLAQTMADWNTAYFDNGALIDQWSDQLRDINESLWGQDGILPNSSGQGKLADMQDGINDLNTELGNTNTSLSNLGAAVSGMNSTLVEVNTELGKTNTELGKTNVELGKTNAAVSGLNTAVDQLNTALWGNAHTGGTDTGLLDGPNGDGIITTMQNDISALDSNTLKLSSATPQTVNSEIILGAGQKISGANTNHLLSQKDYGNGIYVNELGSSADYLNLNAKDGIIGIEYKDAGGATVHDTVASTKKDLGYDVAAGETFADAVGNGTGTNVKTGQTAKTTTVADAVNDLDNAIGDVSVLANMNDFQGMNHTSLTDAVMRLDEMIHGDANGDIHIGQNSFVLNDSDPTNHTIGTSGTGKGSEVNMVSDVANNNVFTLTPSASVDYSALRINGDYAATQDWVRSGMSQIYSDMDAGFRGVNGRIDSVETEMRSSIAGAAALSALVPNARAKGNTQVSFGTGTYRDQYGIAAGMFHYVSDNVLLNAGASYSHDNFTGRAGITIGW
ncbi:MAG: YadA C-terminal domain-containing protein [Rickettsiales bacterium]|jgi:hypothetical protein|nr:YadA C-terminal domain-containing protein [Rickettsiales bacterium]